MKISRVFRRINEHKRVMHSNRCYSRRQRPVSLPLEDVVDTEYAAPLVLKFGRIGQNSPKHRACINANFSQ
jgi:hypothetical protein